MKRPSALNNGDIAPDERWRTITESGGPDRRSLNNFRIPSDVQATSDGARHEGVSHAAVARAVWGDSNVAFDAAIEAEGRLEQESRPHVFVLKRRFRNAGSAPPDATSRLIGEDEFSEIYAATEFAASADLWFDSTVTISWRFMGEDIEANVQKHFKSFTKCLREWFATKRIVPCAYIYAHEHGSGYDRIPIWRCTFRSTTGVNLDHGQWVGLSANSALRHRDQCTSAFMRSPSRGCTG